MAVSKNFYEEGSQTGTPLEAIASELGLNSLDCSLEKILEEIVKLKDVLKDKENYPDFFREIHEALEGNVDIAFDNSFNRRVLSNTYDLMRFHRSICTRLNINSEHVNRSMHQAVDAIATLKNEREEIARSLELIPNRHGFEHIGKAIAELKRRSDGFTVDELVQGLDLRKNPNVSWDKMAVIEAIACIKYEASSARQGVQWYQEWVREILKALDITTNFEIGSTGNKRAILRAIANLKLQAAANGAIPDPENTIANQSRPEFTKFSQDIADAMSKVNQAASEAVQDLRSRGYGFSDESQEVEVADESQHLRNEVQRLNLFLSSANEMLAAISRELGYQNYHPTQVIDEIRNLQKISDEVRGLKMSLEASICLSTEAEECLHAIANKLGLKAVKGKSFNVEAMTDQIDKLNEEIRQLLDRNTWQSKIITKLCQAAGFDVQEGIASNFDEIINMIRQFIKDSEDRQEWLSRISKTLGYPSGFDGVHLEDVESFIQNRLAICQKNNLSRDYSSPNLEEFHYLISTTLGLSTKEILTQDAIDRIKDLKAIFSGESLQILFATESLETMMNKVAEIFNIDWHTIAPEKVRAIREIFEAKNRANIAVVSQARMLEEVATRFGLESFSLKEVREKIAEAIQAKKLIRDIAMDLRVNEDNLVKAVQDLANKSEDNAILRESCEDLARRLRDTQHREFDYKCLYDQKAGQVVQLNLSNNELKDQLIIAQEKLITCLDNLAWMAEHGSDR